MDDQLPNVSLNHILECTICLEIPASPVYNCANGHILCGICHERVKICGICNNDHLTISIFAERLLKRYDIAGKCHNSGSGCPQLVKNTDLKAHLENCEFRPVICQKNCKHSTTKCGVKVDLRDYGEHLANYHDAIVISNGNPVCFAISRENRAEDTNFPPVIIKHNERNFVWHVIQKNGSVHWWVTVLGSKDDARKYYFESVLEKFPQDLKKSSKMKCNWNLPTFPYHKHSKFDKNQVGEYAGVPSATISAKFLQRRNVNSSNRFPIGFHIRMKIVTDEHPDLTDAEIETQLNLMKLGDSTDEILIDISEKCQFVEPIDYHSKYDETYDPSPSAYSVNPPENLADDCCAGASASAPPAFEINDRDQPNAERGLSDKFKTLQSQVQELMTKKQFNPAISLIREQLPQFVQITGKDHPDIADLLEMLASVYKDQYNLDDAVKYSKEALEIRRKVFDSNHPSIAANLNNLCILHGMLGNYQEAENLSTKVLEIQSNTFGPDHLSVAKQLEIVALTCQNQGKYNDVELYCKRALEIYVCKLGRENPTVTKAKNSLASCYIYLGKFKEAETLYKEVQNTIFANPHGVYHRSRKPIWQVAEDVETKVTKKPQAVQDVDFLCLWLQSKPDDAVVVAGTLKNLGIIYKRQGKLKAAEIIEESIKRLGVVLNTLAIDLD